MTAPQTAATTDTQSTIAALQQRLDAALVEKAVLAEALTARDAALTQRNSEYGERIEQQAATIDVLKAMSASPGDTQPVFDLIVRRAVELCNAQSGGLFEYDGERVHIGTIHGLYEHDGKLLHVQSLHGTEPNIAPTSLATYLRQFPMPPKRGSISMRAVLDSQIMHIRDMREEVDLLEDVQRLGHRSQVSVPLLRDARAIGVITIAAHEPGGFSDSQIQLLQTFAEQAVIAIISAETYRALQTRTSDLLETLEFQTATSEVLKVISRSTFDLQPVLDTVVETAAQLCDADQAVIIRREGELMRLVANHGFPPEYETFLRGRGAFPIDRAPRNVGPRAIREGRVVHVHDAAAEPGYAEAAITLGKQRTSLGVPLLREGEVIGSILLARQRVKPFTDGQIELVSTFADQAVIAIENTRLITEQREALEQQTATAEVLGVINSSPGDLSPVFDAILNKAHALCGATVGNLTVYKDGYFQALATHGLPEEIVSLLRQPFRPNPNTQGLIDGVRFYQIEDIRAIEISSQGPITRALVSQTDVRTVLFVPLRKDGAFFGFISAHRPDVRLFSEKEIALLENFAAQAVIAMENARLLDELRERTAALAERNNAYGERIKQQAATIDVLKAMSGSPGDPQPVFNQIIRRAVDLCDGTLSALYEYDGAVVHLRSFYGTGPTAAAASDYAALFPMTPTRGSIMCRAILDRQAIHITDYQADPDLLPAVKALGHGSQLTIPLMREGAAIGAISLNGKQGGFTDSQVELLMTFAEQAVIAISSAETYRALQTRTSDLQESLEYQTATSDVLKVISRSTFDLQPVLDTVVETAARLCEAEMVSINLLDGDLSRAVANHGYPPEIWAHWMSLEPIRLTPDMVTVGARTMLEGRVVHIHDVAAVPGYPVEHITLGKQRTTLGIPLLRDGKVIGNIGLARQRLAPFTDRQIALVQNFADQAVMAMENARLLEEVRQRQEELRITFENMGDGVAMFDDTQNLVAWNRKFQDILDVPDDVIARRQTFTEYVRYLAERGEYGADADFEAQVGRLLETVGQMHVFERVRPNGRVIEVRSNPVAGGGFVLIYADITERKRNEAEIRAARDAAEEASRTIEVAYRELKTAQANLIQAEKMASLGQLTAGIAHEIKNPLNFVNNFAALSAELIDELREALAPELLGEIVRTEVEDLTALLKGNLEKVVQHGQRADGIVKSMLEHSRGSSGERRLVDLNALIDEALNLAYHGARAQDQNFNVTLERDFGEGITTIELSPQDMTRVLLNLFSNGFYAARKRQKSEAESGFEPVLRVTTRDLGDAAEIRVWDNGTGIPADIRDKLFQPFFTTKPTGEGTGLGLSISYDVVAQQHGGTITVESEEGTYTEFTITIPRVTTAVSDDHCN